MCVVDEAGGLCSCRLLNGPHMLGNEILFCPLRYRDFRRKLYYEFIL